MLPATEEAADVIGYMERQAPDLTVEFVQKVYSENVLNHRHDVWDVHTNKDRWWVITNPTNLYSQEQFQNMDYALTFHVGICLRVPRSEKPSLGSFPIEPFAECVRYLQEASNAVSHAEEVADYQAIGVRCREALLAFTAVGQMVVPWTNEGEGPKKSDFKAWVDHICSVILSGGAQKDRRQLFKSLLNSAWSFSNWLTHTKSSHWHDAEAAASTTENAVTLCISSVIQHVRGVPSSCPACGSHRLAPERAFNPDHPEEEWERPTCMKCDWVGEPARIVKEIAPNGKKKKRRRKAPDGECVIPNVPLRRLKRPSD
ncbi:hypothetical protein SAMN05444161_5326 [Rhizobiales bacterium GAS191]|nr:hypothetical protein SAMN05444161_5326 [Rhizobiales bacterium GAS191]